MTATFTALDYCLFVGVLLFSALIGLFYMVKERRQKEAATAEDLLMGGRQLSVLPVAMSLLASYMSAITVLGIPTEIYTYGTGYWLVTASGIIMFPLVAFVFLPFFHNMHLDSAYQVPHTLWDTFSRVSNLTLAQSSRSCLPEALP